jgi:hypothetical protein
VKTIKITSLIAAGKFKQAVEALSQWNQRNTVQYAYCMYKLQRFDDALVVLDSLADEDHCSMVLRAQTVDLYQHCYLRII